MSEKADREDQPAGEKDQKPVRLPRPSNIPPPSDRPPHITTIGYPPDRRD